MHNWPDVEISLLFCFLESTPPPLSSDLCLPVTIIVFFLDLVWVDIYNPQVPMWMVCTRECVYQLVLIFSGLMSTQLASFVHFFVFN